MICCCVCCLLKDFPNCHIVCHPNNVYAPLSTTCSSSNHGLTIGSFPVDCKAQTIPFGPTQCSLHYKLRGVTS